MKSFVVIGCGRFGESVARTLYGLGNEVMVIDRSEDSIREISPEVTYAVCADAMDKKVLDDLGLSNFDVAVIAIGSDIEASIMATLVVKELGIKKVIAKAQSEIHKKVLDKIGADKVIFPERDMGIRVAHNLTSTNILDFIEVSPDYNIIELRALKEWENKTLAQLELSNKYKINVMAIKRKDQVIVSLIGQSMILKDDILVIIGNTEDIHRAEKKMGVR